MSRDRFSIAQVTPFAWEQPQEVNHFVARLAEELRRRGHRVAIVAPTSSRELARATREVVASMESEPGALFEDGSSEALLGVGPLPAPFRRAGRAPPSLPIEASRTVEHLMDRAGLDIVHVHEPLWSGASSAALRHSRALNVGTFHWASERIPALQAPRRLIRNLLGRLDGRTASFEATRVLVESRFPGRYRVVRPGADRVERRPKQEPEMEILYLAEEERSATRLFLRTLRRLPLELPWRAVVRAPETGGEVGPLPPRALRDRVRVAHAGELSATDALATAEVVVAASSGIAPSAQLALRALAAGAVPVASRLPQYEEALAYGDLGLLFEPRDADTLAAQLRRLLEDAALPARLIAAAEPGLPDLAWERVADEMDELYAEIAARRHSTGDHGLRRRLSTRRLIDVDLHMHTDHSPDCATPVDTVLETAKARGLGAIAVTDHNEVSGALEARERADGIKVIVAEEVKTADQGEVIGLFIEEKIPRGMTLRETIAEIHRQGGLAYVPHPFDRMHSVPDYEHLLEVVEEIDAIEVFNARVALASFNEEAARFAAKYRIVAGAGSDSHVAQGLGSVKISMRDFDGPEEFLESLRDADIVRHRQSLLYVQALKFLQTKARPARTGQHEETVGGSNS